MLDTRGRFPADELHWAVAGWAKVAPGLGGWKIVLDPASVDIGERLFVIPPSPLADPLTGPKFTIAAMDDGSAVLFGQDEDGTAPQIDVFPSLSIALLALCPLTASQETAADALASANSPPGTLR